MVVKKSCCLLTFLYNRNSENFIYRSGNETGTFQVTKAFYDRSEIYLLSDSSACEIGTVHQSMPQSIKRCSLLDKPIPRAYESSGGACVSKGLDSPCYSCGSAPPSQVSPPLGLIQFTLEELPFSLPVKFPLRYVSP